MTLHCPSNDQTKYMINARSIATMKPGVMLVNTSRGTLVKTDDLVAALRSGQISAAAIDVTRSRAVPPGHPLVKMDNVIITPHVASASPRAVKLRRTVANGRTAPPGEEAAQRSQWRERLGVHHGSKTTATIPDCRVWKRSARRCSASAA